MRVPPAMPRLRLRLAPTPRSMRCDGLPVGWSVRRVPTVWPCHGEQRRVGLRVVTAGRDEAGGPQSPYGGARRVRRASSRYHNPWWRVQSLLRPLLGLARSREGPRGSPVKVTPGGLLAVFTSRATRLVGRSRAAVTGHPFVVGVPSTALRGADDRVLTGNGTRPKQVTRHHGW